MLTDHQNQQVKNVITSLRDNSMRPTTLQGLAGTGKTYCLPYIVEGIQLDFRQVLFIAYTGTAVLNMNQDNAMTAHRLLYKPKIRFGKVVGFVKRDLVDLEETLAGVRLLIIDEFSMMPAEIMCDIEGICRLFGIKILLVGDFFQLPPIGDANPYLNVFDGRLEEPMRQSLDSPILSAAHTIRNGGTLLEGIHGEDLFIGRKNNINPDWLHRDNQWICGLNATRVKLNTQIADGRTEPIVGDKIIFLRNDLDRGISNGTRGEILSIKNIFGICQMEVRTNYGEEISVTSTWQREPTPTERKQGIKTNFDFAYAITAHKSQGATIEKGIVVDESFYFGRDDKEISRRWLYTALTRFQNKCVVLR